MDRAWHPSLARDGPATLSLLPAEADIKLPKLSKHSRLTINTTTSLMHPPVPAFELVLPPCVILQQGGE